MGEGEGEGKKEMGKERMNIVLISITYILKHHPTVQCLLTQSQNSTIQQPLEANVPGSLLFQNSKKYFKHSNQERIESRPEKTAGDRPLSYARMGENQAAKPHLHLATNKA